MKRRRDLAARRSVMKLFSQYKGLPRQTYYLSVIMLIVEIAICCIFPFLSLLCSRKLGFTTVQTGYIVAFTSFGNMLGALVGGKISDEWGRRKSYLGLAVVMVIAMTAAGFICENRAVVLLIFLCNVIASAVQPILSAMVIDICPIEKHNEAFSLVYIFSNIGSATGPAIAGLLFYEHLPWTFFTMSICYAAAFLIMLFRVKETYAGNRAGAGRKSAGLKTGDASVEEYVIPGDPGPADAPQGVVIDAPQGMVTDAPQGVVTDAPGKTVPQAPGAKTSLFSLITHSPVISIFVVCLFLIFMCYTEISYILPLQFADRVGLEEGSRLTSAIWTINGLIVIAFTPVLMLFIKKHRPLFNLMIGCLLYVVGYGLYALPLSPYAALAVVVVWTSGEIFVNTEGTVFLAEISPPTHRGRVVALFQFTRAVGKLICPIVCSHLLQGSNYSVLWLVTAGVSLFVSCVLFMLHRQESKSGRAALTQ